MVDLKIEGTQAEELTGELLKEYRKKVRADLREMDRRIAFGKELSDWENKYYQECISFCNSVKVILGYLKNKD